jgi:ABC-type transport system substrate-binding protein
MLSVVAAVAAVFALVIAAADAAAAPKRGGTLVLANDFGDPAEGLDPHTTIGWPSHLAFELMYTTLVRYNDKLVLEPDLATDW